MADVFEFFSLIKPVCVRRGSLPSVVMNVADE